MAKETVKKERQKEKEERKKVRKLNVSLLAEQSNDEKRNE